MSCLCSALLDFEIGVILVEIVMICIVATSLFESFHVVTWEGGGLVVEILLLVVGSVSWMLVVGNVSRLINCDAVFLVLCIWPGL